jgi:hypothetical protein
MRINRTIRGFIVVALLTIAGRVAAANTIIMATGVDWGRGGSMWLKEDSQDVQAYFAGVIFISLTQGGHVYNRDTLCVDLFTDIFLGQQYDSSVWRPSDIANKHLDRVSWLVEEALLPAQNSTYGSELAQSDWVFSRHRDPVRHLGHRPRRGRRILRGPRASGDGSQPSDGRDRAQLGAAL